ncbi:MAG: nickel-dependent lactate racemase [Spirochaetaceae bacterium]|jgi:nickel-dependent lactate racemase|nr:nickel-dependent lactate racemase [Spirochaetaceae bacterium]
MKLQLPYLGTSFPLEFPDENLLALAEPNVVAVAGSPEEILEAALAHPSGPGSAPFQEGRSLGEFLRAGKRILVIINDATRPTPTEAILGALLPRMGEAGIPPEGLSFLVAAGAHRPPTEAEYRQILGSFYGELRPRCHSHDSKNEQELTGLGSTRNGTPISLNKRLFAADRIIVTGSVEPHYFAGFTGGRKAFLPGLAGYKTIEANHKQALSPAARSLALEGNPVHEDMMDALSRIDLPVFSLMTVLDREQRVAAAAAGDIQSSFYKAVEVARSIFCVSLPEKADIVVSAAKFPMDIDLYQSQKAIDNGALALKDGGVLILVSSCREGIGDEAYAELLARADSPADALSRIRAGYRLGYHKAAKMAAVSRRAAVMAVTELPPERLASLFIESAPSPQEALDEARRRARAGGVSKPRILVLPDGCVTVPVCGNSLFEPSPKSKKTPK